MSRPTPGIRWLLFLCTPLQYSWLFWWHFVKPLWHNELSSHERMTHTWTTMEGIVFVILIPCLFPEETGKFHSCFESKTLAYCVAVLWTIWIDLSTLLHNECVYVSILIEKVNAAVAIQSNQPSAIIYFNLWFTCILQQAGFKNGALIISSLELKHFVVTTWYLTDWRAALRSRAVGQKRGRRRVCQKRGRRRSWFFYFRFKLLFVSQVATAPHLWVFVEINENWKR